MIFGVSQEGNSLSAAPENLKVVNCLNRPCDDNVAPRLRWKSLNYSNFEIQIFLNGSKILGECGNIITNDSYFCDKSVTSIPYIVPIDILKRNTKYKWRVRALDENGEEISFFSEPHNFETLEICREGTDIKDMDCDGIPDVIEKEVLGTSPDMKTLFVRPKLKKTEKFWTEFIELFPGDTRKGFVKIPQFENAGIEVVVIGKPDPEDLTPWHTYERFDNLDYNPAEPDEGLNNYHLANEKPVLPDGLLPCNIMEIERHEKLAASNYNGHTYLGIINTAINEHLTGKHTWSWDVKGDNARDKSATGGKHYGIPKIYNYPLDMYFKEGAYEKIKIGQPTINNITRCDGSPPSSCTKLSPLNLIDKSELQPPLVFNNEGSDTVEFAPFGMDGNGKIVYMPTISNEGHNYYTISVVKDIHIIRNTSSTVATVEIVPYNNNPSKMILLDKIDDTVHKTVFIDDSDQIVYIKAYTRDDVIRRTIVHEMGHALMTGSNSDHCSNPQCIMYENTIDWEPHDFNNSPCKMDKNGNSINCCNHRRGGSLDIRAIGRVYNTPHNTN